jgi:hypothetical protein
MTYVVLKGYLSNPMIDCVKPAVATEPGKVYRKDSSFLWHPSYILSLWTEEKRGSAGRGVCHERSKEVNLFQIYNMDSGNVM